MDKEEELKKTETEETKKANETDTIKEEKEVKENKDEYVPEQLDDEDFENEKKKIKAEKDAKKAEKKAKSKKEKLDENGNPVKKKSHKITLIIVLLLVLVIIAGVVGYFVYVLNKPENVIKDFSSYVSEEDWDNAANLVDMRGYLALFLIDSESSSDDSSSNGYIDYDSKYDTAIDELEGKFSKSGYTFDFNRIIDYDKENVQDVYNDIFGNASVKFNSVKSTERIGKTSLYKVTVNLTLSDKTGSQADETLDYEFYVSKKDGEFKIVGGKFVELIFTYEYYYSSQNLLTSNTTNSTNTTNTSDVEEGN